MAAQLYDLRNTIITVGPVPVQGFGPQEAVSLEWADDEQTHDVGADGEVVISRTNDPRLLVGLTLLQTSAAVPLLMGLLTAQTGGVLPGPAVLIPQPFNLIQLNTGDLIFSLHTIFLGRPAPQYAKNVGVVQFRLLLPRPSYVFGPRNATSLLGL